MMKKRHLSRIFLSCSWKGIAVGTGIWLALLIFTAVYSKATHNPYIFGEWGTCDTATPLILLFMGMISTIDFSAGCCANNVSRARSTDILGISGALISFVFALLDIIAVKTLLTPTDEHIAVNCFFEGKETLFPGFTLSDLMYVFIIIIPLLRTFIGYHIFWLVGCLLTKWYVSGEKKAVIYELAGLLLFLPLAAYEKFEDMKALGILLFIVLMFSNLPVLCTILYFYPYQENGALRNTEDIFVSSFSMIIPFTIMFLIVLLITRLCHIELYSKKGKPLAEMKENADEK